MKRIPSLEKFRNKFKASNQTLKAMCKVKFAV